MLVRREIKTRYDEYVGGLEIWNGKGLQDGGIVCKLHEGTRRKDAYQWIPVGQLAIYPKDATPPRLLPKNWRMI